VQFAFSPAQQWWRLRPSGGFVVYETSYDAQTWTVHYTSVNPAPTTVGASIEDIVDAPGADPVIIDGIDICP
jgi:hypothetical protein